MKTRIRALLLAAVFVVSLLPTLSMAANTPLETGTGKTYETLDAAIDAAYSMTGEVTIAIYGKVLYEATTSNLSGTYDKINFVGMTDDAEISITRNGSNGYISGNGSTSNDCAVTFTDLILSKPEGYFASDAGFMNKAFTVYRVASVEYTNCTFPNGACAAGCPTTYTECTFQKSHEKYPLWAYGSDDITVDECIFDDDRGIKMYAEGAAKDTTIKVKNSDFSQLTGKPAIVLTLGNSVTLEGNTYSNTGVLELEVNGSSNGATVVSDKPITCTSDAGACGVLVGDKIYRTVEDAKTAVDAALAENPQAEVGTVKLLHDTNEDVDFGSVVVDKNGYEAPNVDGAEPPPPPVYGGPVMNWVKVNSAANGVVKSGPLAASAGATITLYPKASTGYVLDTVEVLDAEGNAVALDGMKFQVPLGGVTVNATFKLAE